MSETRTSTADGGAGDLDPALLAFGSGEATVTPPALKTGATGSGGARGGVIDYQPSPDTLDALNMSPDQYQTFRTYLAHRESQSYSEPPNPLGYMGRYQMGPSEITEAANRLDVPVPSQRQFLSDPELQEQLFENYTVAHAKTLEKYPEFANGDGATRAALLAGAHLGGTGGVRNYLYRGQNAHDMYGTSVGGYINGMYGAQLASADGGDGGLGPGPGQSSATMLTSTLSPRQSGVSEDLDPALAAFGSGAATITPPPETGAAAGADAAQPTPAQRGAPPPGGVTTAGAPFTPSTPEQLAVPPGAQRLDAGEAAQRAQGYQWEGYPVNAIDQTVINNSNRGYDTYRLPDGRIFAAPMSGGVADPARQAYETAVSAEARQAGTPTQISFFDPVRGVLGMTVPGDVAAEYYRTQTLSEPWASRFRERYPGVDPNQYATGGAPGAAPPGGTPAAPAAPRTTTLANGMTVTTPEHGASVIAPPAPGAMPAGPMPTPVYPPGAQKAIENAIDSDTAPNTGTLDQLKAEATRAQSVFARVQAIQDNLAGVYAGKTGPTRADIAKALQPFLSGEAIKSLTGTDPSKSDYLEKALLGLVTDQMGQIPQGGYGIMQEIQRVYPSLGTSPNAINMLLNSVKMAAQRSIDMRDGAQAFQSQSFDNYRRTEGNTPYVPLRDYQSQFDKTNPAIDYYKTAQAMTKGFSGEAWKPGTYDPQTGKPLAPAGSFLRHLRAGDAVYGPPPPPGRPGGPEGRFRFDEPSNAWVPVTGG